MKILVVGGTGHIGSYLVPKLILNGHEVLVIARHAQPRYADPKILWDQVKWIVADRTAEEKDNTWRERMLHLNVDIVIDLLCFTPEQNQIMYECFKGRITHFLHCGTIWSYGPCESIPYEERFVRRPITEYGINKAKIETFLLNTYHQDGFPATILHPGHISGRRWLPIDPQGTINGVKIYEHLAKGEKVHLPGDGLATLHHVHGDDVAQIFELAMQHREQSLGEAFSVVAPYAVTLKGLCRHIASLFGQIPNLEYLPLEKMNEVMDKNAFEGTRAHVIHSSCCSISKAQRLLGYQPRYTTEQIFLECIEYLLESGQLII